MSAVIDGNMQRSGAMAVKHQQAASHDNTRGQTLLDATMALEMKAGSAGRNLRTDGQMGMNGIN